MISWQDMIRAVRAVSRLHPDSNRKRFLFGFFDREVPWEQLILLAESEGVDGLLYHHLCGLGVPSVPEAIMERLKKNHERNIRQEEELRKEAEFISAILDYNGLSAVALQGLSLNRIYVVPGLRSMGDLDLLIKTNEHASVVSLLKKIGFRIPNSVYPNNLFKNFIWLDLHTHVLNLDRIRSRRYLFPEDLSPLWGCALPLFGSSRGILKPDPLDNLVLLSAHTLKHGYSRMIWLVDLYESILSIGSQPAGWKKLVERVRLWRQEKVVIYGLSILEGVLGLNIPEWVKRELNFCDMRGIERYLIKLRIEGVVLPEYSVLFSFFAIPCFKERLLFLIESIFPKEDVMLQIYSNSPVGSRSARILRRLTQSVNMAGNGLKQALAHGLFGNR
ncbi:MAG: hypothetical protein C4530_07930 [Desulfobacteraceae bacterium]|nr:MAG: hypothetical protein C4530_07930 [Desulfobacteraceae bacterium]